METGYSKRRGDTTQHVAMTWSVFTKVLSISQRYSTTGINFDSVLVMWPTFLDFSCTIPFCGVVTVLVLYQYLVSMSKSQYHVSDQP